MVGNNSLKVPEAHNTQICSINYSVTLNEWIPINFGQEFHYEPEAVISGNTAY